MSRSSSGPGVAIDDPATGLGIVRFDGHLQFGDHAAISLEEARRRTVEHEQRLREHDAELKQRMREAAEERERLRRVGGGEIGGTGNDGVQADAGGEVAREPLDRGREFEAGAPYPEVNYMPTDTDPNALDQMIGHSARERPRGSRGFSAPEREEVGAGWG